MFEVNPVYYDVPWAQLESSIDAQLSQVERAGAELAEAVSARVLEYSERLQVVRRAVEAAKQKIDKLSQVKQGIVIYSPGSYPVTVQSQTENFRRLFPQGSLISVPPPYEVHRPLASGFTSVKDGLQIFEVESKDDRSWDAPLFRPLPKGLGSFCRRDIRSVADLLVFNTSINPYLSQTLIETADSEQSQALQNNGLPSSVDTDDSAWPPYNGANDVSWLKGPTTTEDSFNVSQDQRLLSSFLPKSDCLTYDPGVSSTPELSLPSDLPFLHGFATDLPDLLPASSRSKRNATQRPSSTAVTLQPQNDILPVLPDISDDALLTSGQSPSASPSPKPFSPVADSTALTDSKATTAAVVAPSAVLLSDPPAPPPPPPPLPALSKPRDSNVRQANSYLHPAAASNAEPQAIVPEAGGDRSSLLEAIRNHQGVKGLRTANKDSTQRKCEKQFLAVASPVDHMAALRERLEKRRNEISRGKTTHSTAPDICKSAATARDTSDVKSRSAGGLLGNLMVKLTTNSTPEDDSSSPSSTESNDEDWSD